MDTKAYVLGEPQQITPTGLFQIVLYVKDDYLAEIAMDWEHVLQAHDHRDTYGMVVLRFNPVMDSDSVWIMLDDELKEAIRLQETWGAL